MENLLKTNQAGASAARPITRSGAQSGDVLIVTGTLGDSVAGLWLLQNPHVEIAASVRERLLRRHFDPTPRLDEMQVALGVGGVRAALDLSDGLAGDAAHIAQRSRLTLEIETSKLPLSGGYLKTVQIKRNSELESEKSAMPIARIQRRNEEKTAPENRGFSAEENENRVLDGAAPVASEALFDARNWALSGGEDYELLLCVAPELAEETARQITTQTGTRATIIGRCIASADDENRVVLRDANGREFAAPRAWTHF